MRRGLETKAKAMIGAAVFSTLLGCGGGGNEEPAWEVTGQLTLPAPVTGIVLNAGGDTAYLSSVDTPVLTNGNLVVVDVGGRQVSATFPLTTDVQFADSLDEEGGLVTLHGDSSAAVIDVASGAQRTLIADLGAGFGRTVLANGFLYAPSQNERALYVAAVDSFFRHTIRPDGPEIHALSAACRTPSGNTVLVIDNGAMYAVDTATNTLRATYVMEFSPLQVLALDEDTALVVGSGALAVIDLNAPPQAAEVTSNDLFDLVNGIALDPTGSLLFLVRVHQTGTIVDPVRGEIVFTAIPEIGVFDLASKTVSRRMLFGDPAPIPYGGFSLAVTTDLSTLLLGWGNTVYFFSPTSPLLPLGSDGR